ncbi:MAG: helix-turn-helix transcriptional regulator [Spirochaetes bacterium]|nr:helix-turn-helix transcriptional regulator [Spirochaetota bacterium]
MSNSSSDYIHRVAGISADTVEIVGLDMAELYTIINILTIFQGLFVGVVLLKNRNNRLPNRILAAIILLYSVNMVFWFFHHMNNQAATRVMAYVSLSLFPVFGPLIYFYVLSMTRTMTGLSWKNLLHFIPVLPFSIVSLQFDFTVNPSGVSEIDIHQLNMVAPVVVIVIVIQLLYIFWSFFCLGRHGRRLMEVYSDIAGLKLTFVYLLLVACMTIGFLAILLFLLLVYNLMETTIGHIIRLAFYIVYLTSTSSAAFFTIRHPKIFSADDDVKLKKSYETLNVDQSQLDAYRRKIIRCMEQDRPYLDDALTLKDFSERVGIPYHHVSMTLNTCLKQNFYTFINQYRCEEVKRLLSDPDYNDTTLLRIAFDSGFNSKTVFNTMFKKYTGLTPSQYRKKMVRVS